MTKLLCMIAIIAFLHACGNGTEEPATTSTQIPDMPSTPPTEEQPPIEALVISLRKSLPKDWDVVETSHGQVEPVRWLKGQGWYIHMKRMTDAPKDYWKRGRKGKVCLWIMDRGYKPRQDKYAGMRAGSGPNVGPAREVGYWHGRRVLIYGGASDWEDWESDLLFTLDSTAQTPMTPDVREDKQK